MVRGGMPKIFVIIFRMAKAKQSVAKAHDYQRAKNKRTSIGSSSNTYPRNKNKKAQFKKYRGQGR